MRKPHFASKKSFLLPNGENMIMNIETRICQNCQQNFTIEPEDFEFYAKIKVPAPTWCPECRQKKKMVI